MYSEKFHINFIWKARILEELLLSLEFFNFLQPEAVPRQPFHSLVHPARGAFDTCAFNYRDMAFNVHLAFPSFYHLEKGTDASWQSSRQMVPNSIYLILLFFYEAKAKFVQQTQPSEYDWREKAKADELTRQKWKFYGFYIETSQDSDWKGPIGPFPSCGSPAFTPHKVPGARRIQFTWTSNGLNSVGDSERVGGMKMC